MIVQMFLATVDLVIPAGIQTNEADIEMGTKPVPVDTKIKKSSK